VINVAVDDVVRHAELGDVAVVSDLAGGVLTDEVHIVKEVEDVQRAEHLAIVILACVGVDRGVGFVEKSELGFGEVDCGHWKPSAG
jgi:hypothetical protein